MVVGLSLVTGLASRSLVRALISAVLGLLLAMIGIDPVMGAPRFTFDRAELLDGVNVVPVAMGMFGIGEILLNTSSKPRTVVETGLRSLVLIVQDIKDSLMPVIRGTGIGFFLGLIPGVGAIVPTFISYVVEKRLSKIPTKFGNGAIEGVAGPETANNAYANAALIPLFTLGIPGSPTIAILMGAFMMNGLIPGPLLFQDHPEVVWTVIASLYIGNAILLILNLPLIPLWVSVLKIPTSILNALVLGFCVLGSYSLRNSVFDVALMAFFGVVGYLFKKIDIPLAPMILTLIVGPMMERSLRQSLSMSGGSFDIFITRPIAVALLIIAVALIIVSTMRIVSQARGADAQL
jgi:putative tricarboxylic transport membrane protein